MRMKDILQSLILFFQQAHLRLQLQIRQILTRFMLKQSYLIFHSIPNHQINMIKSYQRVNKLRHFQVHLNYFFTNTFQLIFTDYTIFIQSMKQKIIILLILQIYTQLFSSSITTISSNSFNYATQIYYFADSLLFTAITAVHAENSFSFTYTANLSNINTANSSCTLNLYTQSKAYSIYTISIRSVLMKYYLPIWTTSYNSSSNSPLAFSSYFVNTNNIRINLLLIGWLYPSNYSINYTLNLTSNTLKIYTNILSTNWMQFTIIMYDCTIFTLSESINSQSISFSSNSAIYGLEAIDTLPKYISINCSSNNCVSSMSSSKYILLLSNYTDISQISNTATNSINWLQIGIIVFSCTIFLVAMLITLKVLKNRFCSSEIMNQNSGELTDNNLLTNIIIFEEVERQSSKKSIFCCICLDEQANCMILPCQHAEYCKTCIRFILESKKECSICRGVITRVQYFSKQSK